MNPTSVLVHGWPYDIHSYAEVTPVLAAHRTITGGVGHNLPQEAPYAFAEAIIDVSSQR
jgi:pimeloyl-ACP methyl ester carboxylesterase